MLITERTRSRIQAAEMGFLRRVAGVFLRDKVRSRVGYRLNFHDSDSDSDSTFRFRFLTVLNSDSLRGRVKQWYMLLPPKKCHLFEKPLHRLVYSNIHINQSVYIHCYVTVTWEPLKLQQCNSPTFKGNPLHFKTVLVEKNKHICLLRQGYGPPGRNAWTFESKMLQSGAL